MGYERARRIHDEWLMAMSFASSAQVTTDSSADSTQITASSSSASSRVDMGDTVSLPSSAFGASLGSVPKPVSLPPCVFSSKMMSVDAKMSTGDISSHPVLMNGLTSSTEPALPPDYAPAQSRSSDSPFQYKTCPQCKKAVPNATRTCKFCLNVFYRKVSRKRKDSLTPPGVKRKPGRPRKNQILSVLPSNSDIPPPPPPTLFDFPVDSIPIDAIQPPTPQESVLSLHPTNPPATVTDDTDVTMADMDSATDGTNAGMDSATDGTNAGMDSSNVVFVHMDLSDVVVPADVDPPSDDPEMHSDYDAIDRAQMASSTPSDLEEEVSRLPFPLPPPPPLSPPPPSPLPPPPPARKRKREGTMRAQKICKNCGKYCANATRICPYCSWSFFPKPRRGPKRVKKEGRRSSVSELRRRRARSPQFSQFDELCEKATLFEGTPGRPAPTADDPDAPPSIKAPQLIRSSSSVAHMTAGTSPLVSVSLPTTSPLVTASLPTTSPVISSQLLKSPLVPSSVPTSPLALSLDVAQLNSQYFVMSPLVSSSGSVTASQLVASQCVSYPATSPSITSPGLSYPVTSPLITSTGVSHPATSPSITSPGVSHPATSPRIIFTSVPHAATSSSQFVLSPLVSPLVTPSVSLLPSPAGSPSLIVSPLPSPPISSPLPSPPISSPLPSPTISLHHSKSSQNKLFYKIPIKSTPVEITVSSTLPNTISPLATVTLPPPPPPQLMSSQSLTLSPQLTSPLSLVASPLSLVASPLALITSPHENQSNFVQKLSPTDAIGGLLSLMGPSDKKDTPPSYSPASKNGLTSQPALQSTSQSTAGVTSQSTSQSTSGATYLSASQSTSQPTSGATPKFTSQPTSGVTPQSMSRLSPQLTSASVVNGIGCTTLSISPLKSNSPKPLPISMPPLLASLTSASLATSPSRLATSHSIMSAIPQLATAVTQLSPPAATSSLLPLRVLPPLPLSKPFQMRRPLATQLKSRDLSDDQVLAMMCERQQNDKAVYITWLRQMGMGHRRASKLMKQFIAMGGKVTIFRRRSGRPKTCPQCNVQVAMSCQICTNKACLFIFPQQVGEIKRDSYGDLDDSDYQVGPMDYDGSGSKENPPNVLNTQNELNSSSMDTSYSQSVINHPNGPSNGVNGKQKKSHVNGFESPFINHSNSSRSPVITHANGQHLLNHANGPHVLDHANGQPLLDHVSGHPTINHPNGHPVIRHSSGQPVINHASGPRVINHASGPRVINHASGPPVINHESGPPVINHAVPFHSVCSGEKRSRRVSKPARFRADSDFVTISDADLRD
eukprot:171318_1